MSRLPKLSLEPVHARVNARRRAGVAQSQQDDFGGSRPISSELLPPTVLRWLEDGEVIETHDGFLRSKVHFSTLQDFLFVHSANPNMPGDLIVANPPYLLDPGAKICRHGGAELGSCLSTRIVVEGPRLCTQGTLILFAGSPIVAGRDTFWESIASAVQAPNVCCEYAELDPDIFGEELDAPAYSQVDRIAAVALVVTKIRPDLNFPAPAAR